MAGACCFTTLDLESEYNQVPVAEQDKPKMAFCTPFGLFEWNCMPFGLFNLPSFQQLMQRMFGDQHCLCFCTWMTLLYSLLQLPIWSNWRWFLVKLKSQA